uniref:RING-type domain-containing protein n=1 Tax=viral metagenome TaxID=1070528 RepID=A0A6C0KQM6_9ZZZZ
MFYTLYTSSDSIIKSELDDIQNEENSICFICLSNNNFIIKPMKEFKNITTTCDCNILIHEICFNEWIKKTNSCPICRIEIQIVVNNSN